MVKLTEQRCVPCEGGVPPLKPDKITEYLGQLTLDWEVTDGKKIKHQFEFKDFKEAIAFVNQVANLAATEGHHPDIHIYYDKVKIVLWTHAIRGLFDNDFILAAKIEEIATGH
ncbi:MAG TPA: 4a-hydroxytetrahydrobiopterin dehydratase [Patescibacteria group bacterium]